MSWWVGWESLRNGRPPLLGEDIAILATLLGEDVAATGLATGHDRCGARVQRSMNVVNLDEGMNRLRLLRRDHRRVDAIEGAGLGESLVLRKPLTVAGNEL